MRKLLLITIIFVLHSFPSFSNPNGKGLVCKCDYVVDDKTYKRKKCDIIYNNEIGFYFENYFVDFFKFYVDPKKTVKLNSKKRRQLTEINDDFIKWTYFTLNRKTLSLRESYLGYDTVHYICEVQSNKEKFLQKIDEVKTKYIKEVNKKFKNKI
jgi:hypothetical protein